MDSASAVRLELIRKWAVKYSLDPALVAAVCEQESSWNQWAVRYEPLFFSHYIQPLVNTNVIHTMTEAIMRATSWGLGQIMGQVARELGFKGKYLSELCDPEIGLDFCCKKLKMCIDATSETLAALQTYNGGGNPNYGHEVLARVNHYQEGDVSDGNKDRAT